MGRGHREERVVRYIYGNNGDAAWTRYNMGDSIKFNYVLNWSEWVKVLNLCLVCAGLVG